VYRIVVCLGLAACASRLPPVATPSDSNACLPVDDATALVTQLVSHGERAGVCFDARCFLVDLRRGTTTAVSPRPSADAEEPVELRPERTAPSAFEVERTEHEISVCDHNHACSTFPSPVDTRTLDVVLSADGKRAYFVLAGPQVYLETYDLRAPITRIGHLRLTGIAGRSFDHGVQHIYSLARVGTALLVGDGSVEPEAWQLTLVDPDTGKARNLGQGSAVELDAETVLMFEAKHATIVRSHGLDNLTSYVAAGDASHASGAVGGGAAVVAFSNPAELIAIDLATRRFGASWRIPVCAN
jgi:hypothetical protein